MRAFFPQHGVPKTERTNRLTGSPIRTLSHFTKQERATAMAKIDLRIRNTRYLTRLINARDRWEKHIKAMGRLTSAEKRKEYLIGLTREETLPLLMDLRLIVGFLDFLDDLPVPREIDVDLPE